MEKFAALGYNNDEKIIRETIETPKNNHREFSRSDRDGPKDSRFEIFGILMIFFRMHFV